MKSKLLVSIFFSIILITHLNAQNLEVKYPLTKKVSQEDNYHGKVISDPYRWLENDSAADVKDWIENENKTTYEYLNKIPFRSKIHDRISEIVNYERFGIPDKIGEYYIYTKNDGLQNQSVYCVQKGLNGAPTVFIDPNKISADGTSAITILGYSNDKKYCAYGINQSGSDWQTIRIKEIASGKDLKDELKWVKFSGASWNNDGFYYGRYQEPGKGTELSGKNENHQIWYHKLNTSQKSDELIYEDKEHPLRYFGTQTTEDNKYLFIYVLQGTYGTQILYQDLSKPKDKLKLLFKGFDNSYSIIENYGSSIFVKTDYNAPNNQILTIDLDLFVPQKPLLQQARVIIPEKKYLLENATSTGNRLILNYLQDVSSHVYLYSFEGVQENEIALPGIGTASGFEGSKNEREVFFTFCSFTTPATIYRYHIDNHRVLLFKKSGVKFNSDDYITEQVFYPSKDGTKVPMFMVHKKGLKKTGQNPTLLYGYGGFNINMTPTFSASRIVLLENGGIFAMANIRGGGEYGEDWHKGGMLLKKQNSFDDFIAAGQYLVNEKYTSPDYLAIQGGSNGGLLVGAVINQRPDLFKVAFPAVGVMDMLRYQKFTVGWGWMVEYGSSDTIVHFNNLIRYSPLHNISTLPYPATLVTTGDHDDRVVPAHSFKYIATLQEHQVGTNPVLIRVDVKAGHGAGKPLSKAIDEITDIYSFMFYNMKVPIKY